MSFISKAWTWVKKEFTSFETGGIKVAVAVTEDINTALNSGDVDDIQEALAAVDPNLAPLSAEVVAQAKVTVPKVLADELGLETLIADPTPTQAQAWLMSVVSAFGNATLIQKSKLYSTLAVQLAQIYGATIANANNWAGWINAVQEGFEDYKADVAAEVAAPAAAPVAESN